MTANVTGSPDGPAPSSAAGRLREGGPTVVGLGGGHGLAATLGAARRYAGAVTAVVSVADDGGSSGRLREDLGIPAPGDVRRCLVALAAEPDGPWARAFESRFEQGELAGHPLGNLVVAALERTTGSFIAALDEAARLLGACGRVLPATSGPVVLTASAAGRELVGQRIVEDSGAAIDDVRLDPADAAAPPEVVDAIARADQVVLGPGSLYTSVLAVTAVPAVRGALARRSAGVVFVCNLRPSKETIGYDVAAHVEALLHHGVRPHVVLADPATMDLGAVPPDLDVVTAAVAGPDGWSHDVVRLAGVLADLV